MSDNPEEEELECAPAEEELYLVDENLDPVTAVFQYSFSHLLPQRLAYIKGLAAIAPMCSRLQLEELFEVLLELLHDECVDVRVEALQQLDRLGDVLGGLHADPSVMTTLLQIAAEQVSGCREETRDFSLQAYDSVCAAAGQEACCETILHYVAGVASSYGDAPGAEPLQAQALTHLGVLAIASLRLPGEKAEQHVMPLFRRLTKHRDIRIREVAASMLPELYRHTASLASLPAALEDYAALCNDLVWSVRQSAARVVAKTAQVLGNPARSNGSAASVAASGELQLKLIKDVYLGKLVVDVSQWVKCAALQQAGELIRNLIPSARDHAPWTELLSTYCRCATAVGAATSGLRSACAESLAAVVEQAGAESWPHLEPTYHKLLASAEPAVLRALVSGSRHMLHVLSGTLGPERAVQVVLPSLLSMLLLQMTAVADVLAVVIVDMIKACPPAMQEELLKLLPLLVALPENGYCGQWRTRHSVAVQLAALCTAVPAKLAESVVVPCALGLCHDPVWAVRKAAAEQVGTLLTIAVSEHALENAVILSAGSDDILETPEARSTDELMQELAVKEASVKPAHLDPLPRTESKDRSSESTSGSSQPSTGNHDGRPSTAPGQQPDVANGGSRPGTAKGTRPSTAPGTRPSTAPGSRPSTAGSRHFESCLVECHETIAERLSEGGMGKRQWLANGERVSVDIDSRKAWLEHGTPSLPTPSVNGRPDVTAATRMQGWAEQLVAFLRGLISAESKKELQVLADVRESYCSKSSASLYCLGEVGQEGHT